MAKKRKPASRALRWGDGFINERPQKDGSIRYQGRWSEPDPNRGTVWRARTFSTQEAAEKHLREVGENKRDGRYTPESRMTIEDAVKEYISRATSTGRWKPNTVATNTILAQRLVYPHIGDLRVTRISHRQLQLWVDDLRAQGKSVPATANALSLVRSALTELVRLDVLRTNPANGVTVGARTRTTRRTWTTEEVRKVLETSKQDPETHALYTLALTTGLRPGEIRALTWTDVDLQHGRLRCSRTITKDANQRQIMGTSSKTGKARIIVLTPHVIDALKAWRAVQIERQLAHRKWQNDDIVFDAGDGTFMKDTAWQRRHREVVKRAGVEHISPHAMRHTAATLMLEQDIHPKVVQEILGHSSITMTLDLYSHVSADLQQAAVERLTRQLLAPADTTTLGEEEEESGQSHA